nr:hypothetical protein [Tanacetum cinerariifolium]
MVAILEKYEHNIDFYQIVDFVEASPIRYALTINLTVYVSHIRQFWSTARIKTTDEGTKILATVDGKPRTISESSIRRNLKLKDEAGISSLLDTELFKNLKLMGEEFRDKEEVGIGKSIERGSNDTEEPENVPTSLDAARILTSGGGAVSVPPAGEIPTVSVPTASGMVPTASPIFTTATVTTSYSRRKGKEKMVESDTPKKKKLQKQIDVQVAREMEEQLAREYQRRDEQIVRDVEIARIHAEEELQMMIDGLDKSNNMIAKHLHEYEQAAAELTIGEKI